VSDPLEEQAAVYLRYPASKVAAWLLGESTATFRQEVTMKLNTFFFYPEEEELKIPTEYKLSSSLLSLSLLHI